jgi:hypothetical protein
MAKLPTFISTAQTPSTTGVGSPRFVQQVDVVGSALQKAGAKGQNIAQQMFATEAAQAVNQAKLGATLELNNLTTELGKMSPGEAMTMAPGRIQQIYEKQTQGMSDAAREDFDSVFSGLSGQAQVNINSQAVKTHNDIQQAGLITLLHGLKKTHDPIKNPLSTAVNIKTASDAIAAAIQGQNITREEGTKMFIKFRKELAEEGVTRWINGQTADTLMSAYDQMDKGNIKNPAIQALWSELDEDKKKSLRTSAMTELARLGSRIDKQNTREINQQKQRGKEDLLLVYTLGDSQDDKDRKDAAMARLATNAQVPIATYKQMLDDTSGRSDQFNNISLENDLYKRIIVGDKTLTINEILIADKINFGTKQKLIAAFEDAEEKEMKQAAAIIRSHPLFVPKSKTDKLLNSDKMNAAQAKLYSEIYAAFLRTKPDENFDAVGETNKAILAMSRGGGGAAITNAAIQAALARLARYGITDQQSADDYIGQNKPNMDVRTQIAEDLITISTRPQQ